MRAAVLVFCLGLVGHAGAQGAPSVQLDTILLPDDALMGGVGWGDVNGDGLVDLVLATRGGERRLERRIDVHLARPPGGRFVSEPDTSLDIPADLTAFSVGDLHPDPGEEVLLLSAHRAVVWRVGKTGKDRFVKAADLPFLWQLPRNGRTTFYQEGLRDLDGDGLVDLIAPVPEGHAVFLQRRPAAGGVAFEPRGPLLVPEDARLRPRSLSADDEDGPARADVSFTLRLPFGGRERPPLVDTVERAPRPTLVDFDGDGRVDLMARTPTDVLVWTQAGGFDGPPSARFKAPVLADRSRRLDPSYATRFLDLDGDHRSDTVIFAGDRRAKKPRTQILIYRQGKASSASVAFDDGGRPDQLLVVGGLVRFPQFVDVDGDGRRDLIVASFRPELVGALAAATKEEVELEVLVFLNRSGRFDRQATYRFPVGFVLEGFSSVGSGLGLRFVPDLDGDGEADLLLRTRRNRLEIRTLGRDGKDQRKLGRRLHRQKIANDANLHVGPRPKGGGAWFIVEEDDRVVLVRVVR